MGVRTVVTDTDSPRAISGADRFVGSNAAPYLAAAQRLYQHPGSYANGAPLGSPAHEGTTRPPYPRAHARLKAVGVVLGQLHPPGGGQEIIAIA